MEIQKEKQSLNLLKSLYHFKKEEIEKLNLKKNDINYFINLLEKFPNYFNEIEKNKIVDLLLYALEFHKKSTFTTPREVDIMFQLLELPQVPKGLPKDYPKIKDLRLSVSKYEEEKEKLMKIQLGVEKILKNKVHKSIIQFVDKCFENEINEINMLIRNTNLQITKMRGRGKRKKRFKNKIKKNNKLIKK